MFNHEGTLFQTHDDAIGTETETEEKKLDDMLRTYAELDKTNVKREAL